MNTSRGNGGLLKSRVSSDARKTILRMSRGFLAIQKTVAKLICERPAKSWTFLHRAPGDT